MLSRYFLWSFIASTALVAMTFFSSCTPDEEITDTPSGSGNVPSLTTVPVSNITSASATSGGTITSTGGSAITQRGVILTATSNSTIIISSTNDSIGAGSFTSNLSGLTASTTYYVRSYATNSVGTAYGNELSFTTSASGVIVTNPGAGVTFDGYTYSSVVLGNGQEWMAENLRTTVYANGDPIANEVDGNLWSNLTTGAWVHYQNNSGYETPYGKLYNWYTVDDSRNVCPTGWHVPSDDEWSAFVNYLDPDANGGNNFNIAGGKMKSTQYWLSPNQDANNESGFSGLPGGNRSVNGAFYGIGAGGSWWCSTETDIDNALIRYLWYNDGNADSGTYSKREGFSVRCVRD